MIPVPRFALVHLQYFAHLLVDLRAASVPRPRKATQILRYVQMFLETPTNILQGNIVLRNVDTLCFCEVQAIWMGIGTARRGGGGSYAKVDAVPVKSRVRWWQPDIDQPKVVLHQAIIRPFNFLRASVHMYAC